MKKRTAEMIEALKAEGIKTDEDMKAEIRSEQPLDLSLMLCAAEPETGPAEGVPA